MEDTWFVTDDTKTLISKLYYECLSSIRNHTNNNNNTNDDNSIHCPGGFDGYACWHNTNINTVATAHCPDYVTGFQKHRLAYKTCLENGSWYKHPETQIEWANYTNCVDVHDLEFRQFVNALYIGGYSISLGTLLISLCIFLSFRSLKCTRIKIHIHLFISLALNCIAWIIWYKFFVDKPNEIGVSSVFVKDAVAMNWFMVLAWISPVFFVSIYAFVRSYHPDDNSHCWLNDSATMWILTVPVIVSLLLSIVFLVNVVRVLLTKLHPNSDQPAPLALRKAARATLILVPLFGLQHLILPFRPNTGTFYEKYYQVSSALLVGLQGFCVSCLFCFANHDVTFAMRNLFSRYFPRILPPNFESYNGPAATQSRDVIV